jgi:hypothetical protein
MSAEDPWYIPIRQQPAPKIQLPPPPPPRPQPITYPLWVLLTVAGVALVSGAAIGTVIDVGSQLQPVPTTPTPAKP